MMQGWDWAVIGIYVAFAAAAWTALVFVIPANLEATFRHRMWTLRDDLYDDIRAGKLPSEGLPCLTLSAAEGAIAHSHEISFLNIVTVIFFSPRKERKEAIELYEKALRNMTPDQQKVHEIHSDKLARAMAAHALFGTPSGWVVLPILMVAAVVLFAHSVALVAISKLFRRDPTDFDPGNPIKRTEREASMLLQERLTTLAPTREELIAVG